MGNTTGKLFIYTFNITKKEMYSSGSIIDFKTSNPLTKANMILDTYDDMIKNTKWNEEDVIIRIIMISGIYIDESRKPFPMEKPICFHFKKNIYDMKLSS